MEVVEKSPLFLASELLVALAKAVSKLGSVIILA
jgi:hypothetical protein